MTEIKVISSSSAGNGYLLVSNHKTLLLELGCKPLEYYSLADGSIVGAVCSHKHDDHFNPSTVKSMLHRGVPVYIGEKVYEGVFDQIAASVPQGDIYGVKRLLTASKTDIGGFTIQPFEIAHNVPNYGFLIEAPSGERIVFVTDAIECKYRFKDIDCIMVECNHDDDTLLDNLAENEVSPSHPENHLGLSDCIAFCKANMNPHLKQVVLIHLSHQNINESYAHTEVQAALPGVPVAVAHPDDRFIIENDKF